MPIIIAGEIVADDDPRAVSRRNGDSGAPPPPAADRATPITAEPMPPVPPWDEDDHVGELNAQPQRQEAEPPYSSQQGGSVAGYGAMAAPTATSYGRHGPRGQTAGAPGVASDEV